MFIRKWQLMFLYIAVLYIALVKWGAGHLTVIIGTEGGTFANESCPRAECLTNLPQCPGFARVVDGSRLELTRTYLAVKLNKFPQNCFLFYVDQTMTVHIVLFYV